MVVLVSYRRAILTFFSYGFSEKRKSIQTRRSTKRDVSILSRASSNNAPQSNLSTHSPDFSSSGAPLSYKVQTVVFETRH